jgi:hypothetical protein
MNSPSPLPYAPKRKTPLSLWNPLDYLQLLYRVLYFPQALHWYVETFGNFPFNIIGNGKEAIRNDPIQRQLAIQGLLLVVIIPLVLAVSLRWFGVPINMEGLAFGLWLGPTGSIAGSLAFGIGGASGWASSGASG